MNILIIRLHDFSTIMATIPLVNAIAAKYPDATIDYVSSAEFVPYLSTIPAIKNTYVVQGDITPTVLQLLKNKYTHTVDLQSNRRSNFITSHLGQQFNAILTKYKYPKRTLFGLFSSKAWIVPNLSTQFIACTKDLQLPTSNIHWVYTTTDADALGKDDIPTSHSLGYYCIDVQGLQSRTTAIASLLQQINFPVILMGTQQDFTAAEQLKQADTFKIYNACGKYSQAEQYNILKNAKLLIANHRDVTCLAVAAKVPLLDTNAMAPNYLDVEPYCHSTNKLVASWQNVAELAASATFC
jgi:ADP-heptose:LPS heptosyltransferase